MVSPFINTGMPGVIFYTFAISYGAIDSQPTFGPFSPTNWIGSFTPTLNSALLESRFRVGLERNFSDFFYQNFVLRFNLPTRNFNSQFDEGSTSCNKDNRWCHYLGKRLYVYAIFYNQNIDMCTSLERQI